jgi:multidrug resistance efflux pump
MRQTLESV